MNSQEVARPMPREQTIMHPNKWELKKLVREEKAAGRIGQNTSDVVAINVPGRQLPVYAVKVVRLADAPPPPSPWRRWLWIGTGGISAVAALGAMLWHARYVIGAGLLVMACVGGAVWWIVTHFSDPKSCPCPNHRARCRG
jgi:hypothetical protein